MSPVNKPLLDGFCHTLLNMDIVSMGESLRPRPGLRSTAYELIETEETLPIKLQLLNGIVWYSPEQGYRVHSQYPRQQLRSWN